MSHDDVAIRVIRVLTDRLGIATETVMPTALLADDLGVDSVDAVEFALALEREFNLTLPDAILVDVRTVQEAIDLIREHAGAASEVAPS
jgi:acyl carrier protein